MLPFQPISLQAQDWTNSNVLRRRIRKIACYSIYVVIVLQIPASTLTLRAPTRTHILPVTV